MLNNDKSVPKTLSGPPCLVPHLLILASIALVSSVADPARALVALRADADAGNAVVEIVVDAALAVGTDCSSWPNAAVREAADTTLAPPAADVARSDRRTARSWPQAPSAERRWSVVAGRGRSADSLGAHTAPAVGLAGRSRSDNGTKGVCGEGQAWLADANPEVSDPPAPDRVATRNRAA